MSKVKIIILAAIILAVGAIFLTSRQNSPSAPSNPNAVATVNGEELSRSEYDLRYAELSSMYEGQEVDEDALSEQILTQMISERLLLQEASAKGISVPQEEIDAQFQMLDDQFETDEEFDTALQDENLTRDQLRINIHNQMTIEKYIDQVTADKDITVTDEEVVAAFEESVAGMENGPTLEEVRGQVEDQVRNQKITEIMLQVIEELRNKADIQIFI